MLVALLLSSLASLPAQSSPNQASPNQASPNQASPKQGDPLKFSLSVVGEYARHTDKVSVKLDIEAKQDASIQAALLTGAGIQVTIGEKTTGSSTDGGNAIPIKQGTKLSVEVPINLAALVRGAKYADDGTLAVKFAIPGHQNAVATMKVVRDLRDVPVESLDHKKTRVALVTNFGTMVVAFRPDKAPNTVANFIKLSKDRFYDGTRFHRVLRGFMIQGGDPLTKDDNPMNDGTGDPGYKIDFEGSDLRHDRGVLSMARGPDKNSAGCQFFVMHGKAPHLDNEYAAFASLSNGLETLDRIANVAVERSARGEPSVPTRPIELIRAVVIGVMK